MEDNFNEEKIKKELDEEKRKELEDQEKEKKELEELEKLEIKDLLIYKNWKGKKIAYQKLENKIKNNENVDNEYESLNSVLINSINISLTEIQKIILQFLNDFYFNENFLVKNIIKNNFVQFFKIMIEKYYSSNKPNIVILSFELLNTIFNDIHNPIFFENLSLSLNSNNVKKNTSIFDLIIKLIEKNGFKKFEAKNIFKYIDKFINSINSNLRNNVIYLLKLIVRFFGWEIIKCFTQLKKVLIDELNKDYEENKDKILEADKTILVDNDEINEDGIKINKKEESKIIDLYDIVDEINIFSKYNESWMEKTLSIKNWNKKKQVLEELIKDSSVTKISNPPNFFNLLNFLKKIISDNNLQIQICGIKIIGNISKSLRKNFQTYLKPNINILLNKLKDKKLVLIENLWKTFENTFFCLDIIDYFDEVKDLCKDNNSYLKLNILKLIKIYYNFNLKTNAKNKNITFLEKFKVIFDKLINDRDVNVKKQTNIFLKNEIDNDNNDLNLKNKINNLFDNNNPSKTNNVINNKNKIFNRSNSIKSPDNKNIIDIKIIFEKLNNKNINTKILQNNLESLIKFLENKNKWNISYYSNLNTCLKNNCKNPIKILQKLSIKVLSLLCQYYLKDFKNLIKSILPDFLINLIDKSNDIKIEIDHLINNISKIKELKSIFIYSINETFKNNINNKDLKIELLKNYLKYIEISQEDNKSFLINIILNSIGDNHSEIVELSKKLGVKFIQIFGYEILIKGINDLKYNISKKKDIKNNIDSIKNLALNSLKWNKNSEKLTNNSSFITNNKFNIEPNIIENNINENKIIENKIIENNLNETISERVLTIPNREFKMKNNYEINFNLTEYEKNPILETCTNFEEPKDNEIYFINLKLKELYNYSGNNPFETYETNKLIKLIENILNFNDYKKEFIYLLQFIYFKIYDCSRNNIIKILFKLFEKLIFNINKEINNEIFKIMINNLLWFKTEYNKFNQVFNLISNNFDKNMIFDFVLDSIIDFKYDSYLNLLLLIIDLCIIKYKNEIILKENHILYLITVYNNNKETKKIFLIFEKLFNLQNESFLNIIEKSNNNDINNFIENLNFKPINKIFLDNIKSLIKFNESFDNENYILENKDYYSNCLIDCILFILNLNSNERIINFLNNQNEYQILISSLNNILSSNFFCKNISNEILKKIIKNVIILYYQSKIDIEEIKNVNENNEELKLKYNNFNHILSKLLINFTEIIEFNLVLFILFELLYYFNLHKTKYNEHFISVLLKLIGKHMDLFIEKIYEFDFVEAFEIYENYSKKFENLNEHLDKIINKILLEIKNNEELSNFISSKINGDDKKLNNDDDNNNVIDELEEFFRNSSIENYNDFLNKNFDKIKENYNNIHDIILKINNTEKWNIFLNQFN